MGSLLRSTQKTSPTVSSPYKNTPKSILPVVESWKDCKDCNLHKTKCNYVFYRGKAPCDVLFVGEAPGHNEDSCGEPFVGRAGELLEYLIKDTGLKFTYGITNIVSCIPLDENKKIRPPSKEEALACRLRLLTTITKAKPTLIILLGKVAKKYLFIPAAMKAEKAIPIEELMHPAGILRRGGVSGVEYKRNLLYLQHFIESHIHGKKKKE